MKNSSDRLFYKVLEPSFQLFSYKIPANTFTDFEEGDTRKLKLYFFTEELTTLSKDSWIQFDPDNQIIYSLPLDDNIGNVIIYFLFHPCAFYVYLFIVCGYRILQIHIGSLRLGTSVCSWYDWCLGTTAPPVESLPSQVHRWSEVRKLEVHACCWLEEALRRKASEFLRRWVRFLFSRPGMPIWLQDKFNRKIISRYSKSPAVKIWQN